jgi:hypothetical protein
LTPIAGEGCTNITTTNDCNVHLSKIQKLHGRTNSPPCSTIEDKIATQFIAFSSQFADVNPPQDLDGNRRAVKLGECKTEILVVDQLLLLKDANGDRFP